MLKIIDAARRTFPLKTTLMRTLCYFSCICRKDREMKLQQHALSRFEDVLDIRSFVKAHVNLTLLISLLLTKEQAFLFQHHRARAIADKPKKSARRAR